MVSQVEFRGVRVEVDLVPEVGLIVFAHIVVHESDRNDEGDVTLPVEFHEFDRFPLFHRQRAVF